MNRPKTGEKMGKNRHKSTKISKIWEKMWSSMSVERLMRPI